jgi:hypothetical protein
MWQLVSGKRLGLFSGASIAIVSWGLGYLFLVDEIDRSSSLVQQTLFTLENNDLSSVAFGSPLKISSGITGRMNQYKGAANISFRCRGSKSTHLSV